MAGIDTNFTVNDINFTMKQIHEALLTIILPSIVLFASCMYHLSSNLQMFPLAKFRNISTIADLHPEYS
jgi:hypothetical protein